MEKLTEFVQKSFHNNSLSGGLSTANSGSKSGSKAAAADTNTQLESNSRVFQVKSDKDIDNRLDDEKLLVDVCGLNEEEKATSTSFQTSITTSSITMHHEDDKTIGKLCYHLWFTLQFEWFDSEITLVHIVSDQSLYILTTVVVIAMYSIRRTGK